jgi:cobalt-zinc-cadmium efflux system membrane fusion protein
MTQRSMFVPALLALALGACGGGSGRKPGEGHAEEPESHEEHREGIVELTPEQVATAKIAIAKVEKRAEAGLLEANAQIEAAADRQARVGTRIAGRVTTIKAGPGDSVKKGTVLAVIDSPDLGRAKADYLAALAAANVARETADREKALFEKKISSEKDWREAEAAAVRARAERKRRRTACMRSAWATPICRGGSKVTTARRCRSWLRSTA